MGTLEIHGLTKRFGDRVVLNDLSLSVPEGEFFVLLGPSGGGKSTILKVVCGIESPDAGQILLNSRDITRLPPRDRNIGMVFQDYGLYPHMSVFENIAYGLEARGMAKAEVSQRVTTAADKLGLAPHIQRVVVELSGGEQQRVALARALAKDADLYLFDEPISNLDPKLRVQARRDIIMVHRAKKKPTLYVTHDQAEALASADRIGVIAHGQLQQVGRPDDLISHPANVFVAGFIGTPAMNLLRGELAYDAARDEHQFMLAGQPLLRLPNHWKPALQAHNKKPLILGLPPAAFTLLGDESAADALAAEVVDCEPLVSEVVVTAKLRAGMLISIVIQDVDESQFTPGHPLRLSVDGAQICLFDPDTERALTH